MKFKRTPERGSHCGAQCTNWTWIGVSPMKMSKQNASQYSRFLLKFYCKQIITITKATKATTAAAAAVAATAIIYWWWIGGQCDRRKKKKFLFKIFVLIERQPKARTCVNTHTQRADSHADRQSQSRILTRACVRVSANVSRANVGMCVLIWTKWLWTGSKLKRALCVSVRVHTAYIFI